MGTLSAIVYVAHVFAGIDVVAARLCFGTAVAFNFFDTNHFRPEFQPMPQLSQLLQPKGVVILGGHVARTRRTGVATK
jgi:hypothetical protein